MSALFAPPRFVPFRWRGSWRAVHESGHVVTAVLLGCAVFSARIDEHGGCTRVGGDPREMLLISVGGCAAERVLGDRDSDIRCSSDDYRKAFQYGIQVARSEERGHGDGERHEEERGQKLVPRGNRLTNPASAVLASLSALDVAGVERNASRAAEKIAARWTSRATALVDAAEVEVRDLLAANRRAVALVAERLEEHKELDAIAIIALAAEARLLETDRRREA